VITIFPWIAIIDKFQHWIYEHPQHTHGERTTMWVSILNEFKDDVIDYSGLETYRSNAWQRQLHLFEVPFYYIEYGIAQLGAIGMWMQYKQDKQQALDNYCNALSMGGTKTLPELYKIAGLEFDFSPEKIKVLMDFVEKKLNGIINSPKVNLLNRNQSANPASCFLYLASSSLTFITNTRNHHGRLGLNPLAILLGPTHPGKWFYRNYHR
jgi:oligoendopeptidase F